MILAALTGLAAGSLHVVLGPDHLAALAPIAAETPAGATRAGFQWGLGHGAGAIALGGLGAIAGSWIDAEWLSGWAEFGVGFVLLAVGAWALQAATQIDIHVHEHTHDGESHRHIHVHEGAEHSPGAHRGHTHAAFAVGALHGAAGTGHLLAVVPSLALPFASAVVYLAAYGLAAVGSMTAFGALMGLLARQGNPRQLRGLMVACGVVACVIGVYWIAAPPEVH